jgi:hypothetical protein
MHPKREDIPLRSLGCEVDIQTTLRQALGGQPHRRTCRRAALTALAALLELRAARPLACPPLLGGPRHPIGWLRGACRYRCNSIGTNPR